ncbi:MAG: MCE family protein [Bacteroidetes bacterium]|nr:MCE family protein [Bacteroidota bacterium]
MKREIQIGIFALAAILLLIFGYQFLKGKNVFTNSQTFYIRFDNVSQLRQSDPVYLNGYQVGLVQAVSQDPEDYQKLIVTLNIENDLKIPDQTVAEINTGSFMGDKFVSLKLKGNCCKESGDFLEGKTLGMISSMVPEETLDSYLQIVTSSFQKLVDTVAVKISSNETLGETGQNLEDIIANMKTTTQLVNALLARQGPTYQTMDNLSGITGNIDANQEQISGTLENVNQITADLQAAKLNETVAELNATLSDLQTTLQGANTAIADVAVLTDKLKSGEGTLGLLLNDRKMYDQLDESLVHLELLLQDIRLNPKRYTRILSKKEKDYVPPEDDPGID